MADHNPWADSQGNQSNQYTSQTSQNQAYQQPQQQQGNYPQQRFYTSQQQPPQPQGHNTAQDYYDTPSQPQGPDFNAWSDSPSGNPPLPARHPARTAPHDPTPGLQRSDTDNLLANQEDRAEQMEYMQAYEASADQSEDDKNRAQLEQEFPGVDGSLIAALYSDTRDLSATREMLQELNRQ